VWFDFLNVFLLSHLFWDIFSNILSKMSIGLNPQLEDHPLSAVQDCIFIIFAATLHAGGRSFIRNLRTRHAVVTGTHLSRSTEPVFYFNLIKSTGYVMHQVLHSTILRSAHTLLMCFVFISEQTATCATSIINWLVFITEFKSVYSAVRTGPLNKAVCASSLKG
jgi:hypothetical protein